MYYLINEIPTIILNQLWCTFSMQLHHSLMLLLGPIVTI